MKALILAGRQTDGPLSHINPNKGLINIGKKQMILYVIEAAKAIKEVDEIALVGNKEDLLPLARYVDAVVEEGGSLPQNVLLGAAHFDDDDEVLVLTSDIPMITPEAIQDFAAQSRGLGADFTYPIVRREVNDRKYPGVARTYVKIKDGSFTGGNIFLVKAGAIKTCMPKAQIFLSYRKKPWKMVRVLGISFALKFLLGTLTIAHLEKRVSELFGVKAKAVISEYPEIGTDVDKPSDLDLAISLLETDNSKPVE